MVDLSGMELPGSAFGGANPDLAHIEYGGKAQKTMPADARPLAWGTLGQIEPFDELYGTHRGLPVDRVFIHDVLRRSARFIGGHVLEVKNSRYTHHFGGRKVTQSTVVDIDQSNPHANLIADLNAPRSLPVDTFDAVIFTQILQYLSRPGDSLSTVMQSLKRGGVALITAPSVGRIDPSGPDMWRFTELGLREAIDQGLQLAKDRGTHLDARVVTATYGNVKAQTAFLEGLAAEEVPLSDLFAARPDYPVIVAARIHRVS